MNDLKKQWIWLPKEAYPENQTTKYTAFDEESDGHYTVAEFRRTYSFEKKIKSAKLQFSGDTEFQLFLNGECIATGPVCVGGDFIGNEGPRPNYYAQELNLCPKESKLHFFARVKMMPVRICEYSKGHGGFMLSALLTFEDGSEVCISTDQSWHARKAARYCGITHYDRRIPEEPFRAAEEIEDLWKTELAPIRLRVEFEVPIEGNTVTLAPGEERKISLELPRIYGGWPYVSADGAIEAKVAYREPGRETRQEEELFFTDGGEYRGFYFHSTGIIEASLKNIGDTPATITIGLIAAHYPVDLEAITETDDAVLNQVLEVCRHTLKICRQTHHLDSTRHCEPLACTGDYYIETLMTAFSFGDFALAEFDILRTAELLRQQGGRMFHTTYSLIWVKMLWDTYLFTGHRELLEKCRDALGLLLNRFEGYLGENGLIENPPDYMFIDWLCPDGISMHHPPKALGQTCLNLFYYGALSAAERIYRALELPEAAKQCLQKAEAIKIAINTHLYDAERGIYFEGLNTPTSAHLLGRWMPENTHKRYYLKHSNILACYFGVCSDGKAILEKIMTNEIEGLYQPYFAHYLLEAIYKWGLRDRYSLAVLEQWKSAVRECPKGLAEGFHPPQPDYRFDHSHAWGGTPLYSLPKALLGLSIEEAGMKSLRLNPSLLGLKRARVEFPTPFGIVVCHLEEGKEPVIEAPPEIELL